MLMNRMPNSGKFVMIDLKDRFGKPALGAVLTATIGKKRISFPVQSTWSYMAANDPRVRIGIGNETSINDIEVSWADGTTTNYNAFQHGTHVVQQQVQ